MAPYTLRVTMMVVFIVVLTAVVSVEARGASGGGKGGSSGGRSSGRSSYSGGGRPSYAGARTTVNGRYSSYSSGYSYSSLGRYSLSYSSSWRTTTEGAAAYLILSRLAVPSSPYRTQYVSIENGDVCQNYEDFNGTMLGEFQCPLDGFQATDLACCGPDGSEYCCPDSGDNFDSSILIDIVIPIAISLVVFLICIFIGCYYRQVRLRRMRVALQNMQAMPPPQPPAYLGLRGQQQQSMKLGYTSHQNAAYQGNYQMPPPPPPYSGSHSGYPMGAMRGHPQYSQNAAYPPPPPPTVSQPYYSSTSPPPPYGFVDVSALPRVDS